MCGTGANFIHLSGNTDTPETLGWEGSGDVNQGDLKPPRASAESQLICSCAEDREESKAVTLAGLEVHCPLRSDVLKTFAIMVWWGTLEECVCQMASVTANHFFTFWTKLQRIGTKNIRGLRETEIKEVQHGNGNFHLKKIITLSIYMMFSHIVVQFFGWWFNLTIQNSQCPNIVSIENKLLLLERSRKSAGLWDGFSVVATVGVAGSHDAQKCFFYTQPLQNKWL